MVAETEVNFSKEVDRVIALAREEARDLGHNFLGTEHLLLGLVRDPLIGRLFYDGFGIKIPNVRDTVEFVVGEGGDGEVEIVSMTARASKVLELAKEEARRNKLNEVSPLYILKEIIKTGEGGVAVLEYLDVNLTELEKEILLFSDRHSKRLLNSIDSVVLILGDLEIEPEVKGVFARKIRCLVENWEKEED